MIRKKFYHYIFCAVTGLLLLWNMSLTTKAEERLFTRQMAEDTAISNSDEYRKLESELALKKAELTQAVKNIKLKKKNMSTFRWSPLINFKFPEQPNLEEEYEFSFKPVGLEIEIDILNHKLSDQKLASKEEVNRIYTDLIVASEYILFYEKRLETLEERLNRTKLEVKTGQASENDVEILEEKIKTIKSTLSSQKNRLTEAKKKLSELCGMDLTIGYRFEKEFVELDLNRSKLKGFIQNTLDKDAGYYETSMKAISEKISLETNYGLMENQYGDKMGYISEYVKNALAGERIDSKGFKQKYDEFLQAIDSPWQGNIRILFLKIPKEWFKGEISGIRYVEDSSYSLYEASLSYQDALLEKTNQKKELEQTVEDEYQNLVSLKNAYYALRDTKKKQEKEIEKNAILFRLGELTQEEYLSLLDEQEETQISALEALGEYSNSIYSFDRLTCGAITELIQSGGRNSVEAVYADGARYYMDSLIQEQEFKLSIQIPVKFPLEITHYELWCNDTRIGERTEITEIIRHLKLAVEDATEVKIRFYNGEEFIDDCVIDPEENSGPLSIVQEYKANKDETAEIGSYSYSTNPMSGAVTISLKTNPVEEIGFYRILNKKGSPLAGAALVPVKESFVYLGILTGSMEEMILEFYDEDESLLYRGYFDTVNMKLKKEVIME